MAAKNVNTKNNHIIKKNIQLEFDFGQIIKMEFKRIWVIQRVMRLFEGLLLRCSRLVLHFKTYTKAEDAHAGLRGYLQLPAGVRLDILPDSYLQWLD